VCVCVFFFRKDVFALKMMGKKNGGILNFLN
jgi:hypothetical protein